MSILRQADGQVPTLTPEEWEKRPTLEQGHTDNLKFDDGKHRVWVSRMTLDDYDGDRAAFAKDRITVETNVGGRWVSDRAAPPVNLPPGTRKA